MLQEFWLGFVFWLLRNFMGFSCFWRWSLMSSLHRWVFFLSILDFANLWEQQMCTPLGAMDEPWQLQGLYWITKIFCLSEPPEEESYMVFSSNIVLHLPLLPAVSSTLCLIKHISLHSQPPGCVFHCLLPARAITAVLHHGISASMPCSRSAAGWPAGWWVTF